MLFDPSTPGGNPNHNTLCGRQIKASYGGKTITVTVADRCEGCVGINDLDLSPSAFQDFASLGEGRIKGTWERALACSLQDMLTFTMSGILFEAGEEMHSGC